MAPEEQPTLDTRENTGGSRPEEGHESHVGPYRLVRKLGEGGMGVVYLAEQIHLIQRRVALKIVRPGMHSEYLIAASKASGRRWPSWTSAYRPRL